MQASLSRELDRGSVEAEQRPRTGLVLRHYLVSSALYGLLLGFLALNPWFKGLLNVSWNGVTALQWYLCLYLLYLLAAPPLLLLLRPRSLLRSKNLLLYSLACRSVRTVVSRVRGQADNVLGVSAPERQALMFLLIRLFFGPLVLSSVLVELAWCRRIGTQLHPGTLMARLDLYYIVLVHALFLADAAVYCLAYHTEAAWLKNEVQCVDTDFWAVLVCALCYPPFNQVTSSLLGASYQDPYILVQGDYRGAWTWCVRGLAVLCLGLLISATLSLFTRAGNLTHRGIVSWGPYRFVRHPGYLAQNLFWLMTLVPWLIPNPRNVYFSWLGYSLGCLTTLAGFGAWAGLFYLRAVTEERFLSRDPEYQAYCRRVKYRFIPGLW